MGRLKKVHQCLCGEADPNNFYKTSKSKCRKCYIARAYPQAMQWWKSNLMRVRWLGAKHRALKRGLEFSITEEDLWSIYTRQEGKCYYSKLAFDPSKEPLTYSIERVDSNKGYTVENVRLLCSSVNYMKNDLTEQQFLFLVKKIYEEQKI